MILDLNHIKGYRDKDNKWHAIRSLVSCDICNKHFIIDKSNTKKYLNQKIQCRSCANKKITPDIYKKLEIEKNLKLLSEIPLYSAQKLDWQCNICGYIWHVRYADLKIATCPNCSGNRHKTEKDYENLAIKMRRRFIGPLPKSINMKTYWSCVCGNTTFQSYNCVERGQECRTCASLKMTGPNNHKFNPLLTKEDRSDRRKTKSKEFYTWLKLITKKFNNTCQKCLTKTRNIHCHHIFNWSSFKNLRYDSNNGICLCKNCHLIGNNNSFHSIYGSKNNTLDQIEEFIGHQILEINRKQLLENITKLSQDTGVI